MSLRATLYNVLKKFEKPYEPFNRITVSRSALLSNFDFFSTLIPNGFVFPVLKANAYGHGIVEVATVLKDRVFPYIAVDGFYESLLIHSISKQPVLVMGAIHPSNYARINFQHTAFVVQDRDTVRAIGKTKRPIVVHIELDTGMTRHGVTPKDLPLFLKLLRSYKTIQVEGVMTHLADADNAKSDAYSAQQTELFDICVGNILKVGFKPKYFHIAQSAGSVKIASRYANALRVGISLYGISPLDSTDAQYNRLQNLRPVLALSSVITKVLEIEKGTTVSYGRTYAAKATTRIGVLPLGYYEGIKRALSNTGTVQYKSNYLSIAGRVNMNHTLVDLGSSNVQAGERVTLISADVTSEVSLAAICKRHNLFSYEVLVGLNQNIRRRIVA